MKKSKNKKIAAYTVAPVVQKLFIVVTWSAFIVQAAYLLHVTAGVYRNGIRLSHFLVGVLLSFLMPLLLFGVAYAASSKKLPRLPRVFEATLLTTMTLMLVAILNSLTNLSNISFIPIWSSFTSSIWYNFIVNMVALIALMIVLIYYKRRRLNKYAVSPNVQKSFAVAFVTVFLSNFAYLLGRLIHQYPSNPNVSSFRSWSLETVLLPTILFAVAYMFSSNKLAQVTRWFESSLLTIIGWFFATVVGQLFSLVYQANAVAGNGYWQSASYQLAAVLLTLVIYITAIRRYARKK